jgi:hypothetical protein
MTSKQLQSIVALYSINGLNSLFCNYPELYVKNRTLNKLFSHSLINLQNIRPHVLPAASTFMPILCFEAEIYARIGNTGWKAILANNSVPARIFSGVGVAIGSSVYLPMFGEIWRDKYHNSDL